jgi:hypothetical protein
VNKFKIIPADNFIWNQQELLQFLVANQGNDIVIDTHEEGCCATATGLYRTLDLFSFNSVTLITNNILETHNKYTVTGNKFFKFFNSGNTDYKKYHTWNRNNTFGAFYNRPLWHRIGLAAELNEFTSALLNFRSDPRNEDTRCQFELQTLFEFAPESAKKFLTAINQFPQQLEQQDGYTVGATTQQHTNQLCEFYPNILVDVVAETFVTGNTFFVTEKTVRPMLLKKPFIIMGSKNFMIYLRQMGFRTFYEYWDEDYDGFEGKDKYFRILDVINSISKKSSAELTNMYNSMQDILDHNYNLLIKQTYSRNIKYIE